MSGSAVVLGASGGIGGAFVRHWLADPQIQVVLGVSRHRPASWPSDPRAVWLRADLLAEDELAAAARAIAEFGPPTRIVVTTGLLSNAALAPERTYRALSAAALSEVFAINAIGPALAAKHLLPLMPRDRRSVFAALSARVGSIGDNRLGGWHAYRASKAALNMLIHTLAIEHARTHRQGLCVALHPGTVNTALSQPFQANVPLEKLFTPEHAAAQLAGVMDRLEPQQTGGFFAYDGQPIPW